MDGIYDTVNNKVYETQNDQNKQIEMLHKDVSHNYKKMVDELKAEKASNIRRD